MISDRRKLESHPGVSSIERRKHARYSFSAAAEIVEMQSRARIQGRLSDLGRGGCYIDSISPFGVGSEVKMHIMNGNRAFIAQGRVVFAAAGMGMGLMFTVIDPEQLVVLEKWLAELSGEASEPSIVEKESPIQKSTPDEAPSHEQNYVLNELIITLMRKKILSDLEGKALLQKLLR